MQGNRLKLISLFIIILSLSLGNILHAVNRDITRIKLENKFDFDIDTCLIEIPFDSVFIKSSCGNNFLIKEGNKEIPYQISMDYVSKCKVILFPLSFKRKEVKYLSFVIGKPSKIKPMVGGHIYPGRDDFAWENNRNGYRVFGPALEAKGEISGGIDFFSKRTTKIVLDQWYAAEEAHPHSYHIDRGEGMDFYAVGPSLGLGGCAPILGDKLYLSKNYTSVDILEKGPLRMVFMLHYAPFTVGKEIVSVSKTVICDAYSSLNHYIVKYDFNSDSLNVGVGCVIRKETNPKYIIKDNKLLSYCGPEIQGKGIIYVGVISLLPFDKVGIVDGHLLGQLSVHKGQYIDYYSGGCWNKGDYATYDSWNSYLNRELKLLINPIKVEFNK